jgi:major membrane immunogen (membrane-anchored lipoprotein)
MTQSRFHAFDLSLAVTRHRGLATVAVAAFLLAGCGSSGGGSRLSKSQYQNHLQTDAAAITKAFKPLTTPPSSLKQLASELKVGVSKLRGASNDLDGVKPPKDAEKDNAKLASGLKKLGDELDALRVAADRQDPTLVSKTIDGLRHSHALIDARIATDDLRKKGYSLGGLSQ